MGFKVLERVRLAPNVHLLRVLAPDVARKARPGQFVIVRADEKGERIPLSLADWNPEEGSVTIVFLEVGTSTQKLAHIPSGGEIPTCVGPLGKPTEIEKFGSVLCAGGCYGIGSIYPIARALKASGNRISVVIEARSSYILYWEDLLSSVADTFHVATSDGSKGIHGHCDAYVKAAAARGEGFDRVIAIGCTYMMMTTSEATRPLGIKTMVSMNPIMVDGTGMCGVCRVIVDGKPRFACVDGPEFDGHLVDWKGAFARKGAYAFEEMVSLRRSDSLSSSPVPAEAARIRG